ncbi:hypothetical protein [Endozoicomonas sp.]|uniref:hypothetical protein n=1 Tax=Endozoicomonas sp. TaxID=1892382 RepID=UPI003AF7161C
MDCIDFIWMKVTHAMAGEMSLQPVTEEQTCYCCARRSRHWAVPLYESRVDSYIRLEVPICAPCNALFHGSYHYLGIDRGTVEKPIAPGKLGLLVGCGLIVSQTRTLLLANPGWAKRLQSAEQPLFENVVQASGKAAMEYAIETIRELPESEFPLVYIHDIGRKKTELVQQLEYTPSRELIIACSPEPPIKLDMRLIDDLRSLATRDKKTWTTLRLLIIDHCYGRIAPNDKPLQIFLANHPQARALAQRLPVDPHEKLQLMRAVS